MERKQPSRLDIYNVACELIEDEGCTTTLDVKRALQDAGYFASQALVSKQMTIIAAEEGWDIENVEGRYNIYSFEPAEDFCDENCDCEQCVPQDQDTDDENRCPDCGCLWENCECEDDVTTELEGKVTIEKRLSGMLLLKEACYFADKHDTVEVTEWANGEGIDVTFSTERDGEHKFELTWGEFNALAAVVAKMTEV